MNTELDYLNKWFRFRLPIYCLQNLPTDISINLALKTSVLLCLLDDDFQRHFNIQGRKSILSFKTYPFSYEIFLVFFRLFCSKFSFLGVFTLGTEFKLKASSSSSFFQMKDNWGSFFLITGFQFTTKSSLVPLDCWHQGLASN